MSLFDFANFSGVIFILGMIIFLWWKRSEILVEPPIHEDGKWRLPIEIEEENLGYIEGGTSLLKEVIVVADRVEEPQNGLLKAVKKNFRQNVIYRFIISDSSYDKEKERYIRVFEGHANAERSDNCPHDDLVLVHKLGREWTDVPYLFYRCKKSDNSDEEFIFGYSGSQIGEGIAENYVLMGPRQARTIFRLVEDLVGDEILPPAAETTFRSTRTAESRANERWFGNR